MAVRLGAALLAAHNQGGGLGRSPRRATRYGGASSAAANGRSPLTITAGSFMDAFSPRIKEIRNAKEDLYGLIEGTERGILQRGKRCAAGEDRWPQT